MNDRKSDISVCVIGAGVCGIVAVKSCLEAGFSVVCFERSSTYGGLWNYRDTRNLPDEEFVPSVMRTTILNTGKETSCFSDYPPPATLPNYMKHSLYMDYIRGYVDHFKLNPHFRFNHEIIALRPECDYQQDTIKWMVEVRNRRDSKVEKMKFDKVMIAVGHHNIPFCPVFKDQHKFKGLVIHSAKLKDIITDDRIVDKRVVVVGFGNSACDAANDIALVASKCYVSSHRSNWFVGRLTPKGMIDHETRTRYNRLRISLAPRCLVDKLSIRRFNSRVNHRMLGLEPRHKPSELVPGINDLFPFRVFTGGVTLKAAVDRFTEDGLIFEGEPGEVYPVDVVVMATGYEAKLSFVDEKELGIKSGQGKGNQEYELYLNMFPTHLKLKDGYRGSPEAVSSLSYIGLVQPAGSILVAAELQSRLACLVFGNKCQLPALQVQEKQIEMDKKRRMQNIRSHSRDQIVGDWIGYSDQVARLMGVKPNLTKLFFKDFALWKQLFFGLSVPYQYRLEGPGSWPKARDTIMEVPKRIEGGFNEGKNSLLYKVRRKQLKDSANVVQESLVAKKV